MKRKGFSYFFPSAAIFIITCLIFFKIFTKALFPFPGDLLVAFNFPWYSGGWVGYDPWTTHKEFIAADVIRQHLPWLKFTIQEFKNLNFPLWNPYFFSGQPNIANIQTLTFNPFMPLFIFLPLFYAWNISIIVPVPLGIFFTYLFLRSLHVSKIASLFAGLAFVFSSYFIYWFETGIVDQTIIWMPLMLFSIQQLYEKRKLLYLLLLIISSVFMILSGHIQTAVFIFIVAFLFYLIKLSKFNLRRKYIVLFVTWIIVTFLLSAIQTIPLAELYLRSPLTLPLAREVFNASLVPFKNFLTLFAPDFFGNPVTENFWSTIYGDGTPNVGILPFLFALYAITLKRWEVKFFGLLCLVVVLYVTNNPVHSLIQNLQLPILTGTVAARTTFILCFSLSVLAGFGLDLFLKSQKNKVVYFLTGTFVLIMLALLVFTFLATRLIKNPELSQNLLITNHNLILPSFILFSFAGTLILAGFLPVKNNFKQLLIISVLIISTVSSSPRILYLSI